MAELSLLRTLLVTSMLSVCLGRTMDMLMKKVYGMEQSIQQDVGFLRETVEANRVSLERVLDILNRTNADTYSNAGIDSNAVTDIKADTEFESSGEVGEEKYAKLKQDIERVKRAFVDEKQHLRQREAALHTEVNQFGEQLNTIAEFILTNGTEPKLVEDCRDVESKLNQIVQGQENILQVLSDDSDAVVKMMNTVLENQESQKILLTNITNLADVTASGLANLMVMTLASAMSEEETHEKNTIRLVDGTTLATKRGRLEVFLNDQWGTVCDDNFSNVDATVACRSLGYSLGEAKPSAYFGAGDGKIWLDEVECEGTEEDLFQCKAKAPIGSHDCSHDEDVGVICI